jgi:prepilin-type N-terminal cleavage/methylation domain-containing protein
MIKRKHKQKILSSAESGFTIIESLVAIVVAAILLAAIAPVIILSTATRIQARRIELATQAAKTYVDSVRTKAIDPPNLTINLPAASTTTSRKISDTASQTDYLISNSSTEMPVATTVPTASTTEGLYCYKKDRSFSATACDVKEDRFYIQAAQIKVTDSKPDEGYRLGIRVYRADVDFSKTLKVSSGNDKKTQLTFAAGVGDRQSPLIEMTTDIGGSLTTFKSLCQRLGVYDNPVTNTPGKCE